MTNKIPKEQWWWWFSRLALEFRNQVVNIQQFQTGYHKGSPHKRELTLQDLTLDPRGDVRLSFGPVGDAGINKIQYVCHQSESVVVELSRSGDPRAVQIFASNGNSTRLNLT